MAEVAKNITVVIELAALTCCSCGTAFGMSTRFAAMRRDDHKIFYCPAGHAQHFPDKSENERLQEELATANEQTAFQQRQAQRLLREKRALKGQMTKFKNRIHNGVCPCCQRHFTNLERHMHSKHPNHTGEVRRGKKK